MSTQDTSSRPIVSPKMPLMGNKSIISVMTMFLVGNIAPNAVMRLFGIGFGIMVDVDSVGVLTAAILMHKIWSGE